MGTITRAFLVNLRCFFPIVELVSVVCTMAAMSRSNVFKHRKDNDDNMQRGFVRLNLNRIVSLTTGA